MEQIKTFRLIGLALKNKTTNTNGQSAIDCGNLWQQFEQGNYAARISAKLSEVVYAVYYNYEGDYRQPFSYFIGCQVNAGTTVPEDMSALEVPGGKYQKFIAKGKMPDCIADAWKNIWASADINRAYNFDFEVYDERSRDWNNATVAIYLSVK